MTDMYMHMYATAAAPCHADRTSGGVGVEVRPPLTSTASSGASGGVSHSGRTAAISGEGGAAEAVRAGAGGIGSAEHVWPRFGWPHRPQRYGCLYVRDRVIEARR